MLKTVGDEVRKHYFDPRYKGVDLNAELDAARQRIAKVNSMNMALSNIAAALDPLDDSHTFFVPPQHAARYETGWLYQMVGNHCFITQVRPQSDAAAKGLKAGDELLSINGMPLIAITHGNCNICSGSCARNPVSTSSCRIQPGSSV